MDSILDLWRRCNHVLHLTRRQWNHFPQKLNTIQESDIAAMDSEIEDIENFANSSTPNLQNLKEYLIRLNNFNQKIMTLCIERGFNIQLINGMHVPMPPPST
jgi:TRAP-type mannitol/chloroaromatic compound transport system substrate-binding protein